MNIVDRILQPDSGFRLILYLACIIILSIYIFFEQRYRAGGLIILFVGTILTIRQYHLWRLRKQKELDIGEYKEQESEKVPDGGDT